MKNLIAPPDYDEPDAVPGYEPSPNAMRIGCIVVAVCWVVAVGVLFALYHALGG